MIDNTFPLAPAVRLPGHDDLRLARRQGRLEPLLLLRRPRLCPVGRARPRPLQPGLGVLRALRRRHPAAVSFVDPDFGRGEDPGVSGDEHPHGDVRIGQAFMSDVVHAFMASPQFKRGALFIVYDEWGGFFDHVRPPRVPDERNSPDLEKDYGQMGFRIPAMPSRRMRATATSSTRSTASSRS